MSSESTLTIRYATPTRYDSAPFGAIYVVKDDPIDTYWVQTSNNALRPSWKPLGEIFTKVLGDLSSNKEFIARLIEMYEHPDDHDINTLFAKALKNPASPKATPD